MFSILDSDSQVRTSAGEGIWANADKSGQGGGRVNFGWYFADVLYGWPLTQVSKQMWACTLRPSYSLFSCTSFPSVSVVSSPSLSSSVSLSLAELVPLALFCDTHTHIQIQTQSIKQLLQDLESTFNKKSQIWFICVQQRKAAEQKTFCLFAQTKSHMPNPKSPNTTP